MLDASRLRFTSDYNRRLIGHRRYHHDLRLDTLCSLESTGYVYRALGTVVTASSRLFIKIVDKEVAKEEKVFLLLHYSVGGKETRPLCGG